VGRNRMSSSTIGDDSPVPVTPPEENDGKPRESKETIESPQPPPPLWPEFLEDAKDNEVRDRFS